MKCNSVLIENFLHGEASVRLPAASEGYFNFLFIYFFYTSIDGTSLRQRTTMQHLTKCDCSRRRRNV